jgi:hypothetical protein
MTVLLGHAYTLPWTLPCTSSAALIGASQDQASIREISVLLSALGVSDALVGEDGEAVIDGSAVEEGWAPVAGLAEETALRLVPHREDVQSQLVDQVVLDQRARSGGWRRPRCRRRAPA